MVNVIKKCWIFQFEILVYQSVHDDFVMVIYHPRERKTIENSAKAKYIQMGINRFYPQKNKSKMIKKKNLRCMGTTSPKHVPLKQKKHDVLLMLIHPMSRKTCQNQINKKNAHYKTTLGHFLFVLQRFLR